MKKTKLKKTALAMTALFAIATPLDLFSDLNIYKVKGEVAVKSGNRTRKAEKRQGVVSSDELTIPRNAGISILDTKDNRVYSSLSPGNMTVGNLIDQATSNASSITRTTNDVMIQSLVESGGKKAESVGVPGVSVHRANALIHAPVDLPEGVSYLQYLRGLGKKEAYNDEYDAIFLRRDINYDDETFHFAVFNTLSKPLYFNIILQCTDREPELHFLDNPIAAPRTQTIVEEYCYIVPDYPDGYIVVASDKNFTASDVKKLLDPSYRPEADFYFTLLRK